MTPSPLRPVRRTGEDEEGPRSPEGLVISALIESGTFAPEVFFLTDEHPSCYQKLWRFGVDYQQRTGNGPPLELVFSKFPDFDYTPGVDLGWAAGELHKAHAARQIRSKAHAALTALNEYDDVNAAFEALGALERPRVTRRPPTSFFDHSLLDEDEQVLTIDVPYPTLSMVSGGIRSGEYWTLAARPGIGKSTIAGMYLKAAVNQGYRVRWYTLEMPKRQVAKRIWRVLAGRNHELRKRLESEDIFERKAAVDELKDKLPVEPDIVDRKDGPITLETVREGLQEVDLVILDPIGLIRGSGGSRMVEDSRIIAAASNQLREDVLATDSSLLSIHHVNRQGVGWRDPPQLDELAETDWIPRDSDVVVTMTRYGREDSSVMYHAARKVREGPGAKWFSRYDPKNARFEEIKRDVADEIDLIEGETTRR